MQACSPASADGDLPADVPRKPRRGFFAKTIALVLGATAYAVPAVAGVVAFLNPLRQKSQAGEFLRITSLETLPNNGTPRKFPVILDRNDAWNRFPKQPVGAVFLSRTKNGGVRALNVVCPHNGCFVDYDPAEKMFFCPCHKDTFGLSGERLKKGSLSLRDMDSLDVHQEKLAEGEVWVKFQNFRLGTAEKVAEV